jgi:hypothetical protein
VLVVPIWCCVAPLVRLWWQGSGMARRCWWWLCFPGRPGRWGESFCSGALFCAAFPVLFIPACWICSCFLPSSSLADRGGEERRRGSPSSSWMVVWGLYGASCVSALSSLELSSSSLSTASVVIPLDPVGVGQLLLFYMYKGHV